MRKRGGNGRGGKSCSNTDVANLLQGRGGDAEPEGSGATVNTLSHN